jgi:diguanylate cyclase (GGDEF)-like protein/PAS domain S-box-containing protein
VGHGQWTRAQLSALVAGKRVMMRGAEAQVLRVPDWLAQNAGEIGELDSAESVDTTHPEDRSALIESFVDSVTTPSEPCRCLIRNNSDGEWFQVEVTWINLLDHPDVEGILCIADQLEALEVVVPEEEDGARSADTSWMIVHLDLNGVIRGARGAVDDILGYDAEELIGHNAVDFLHESSMASIVANWVELRQDPGRTRTSREAWRHRDGSTAWLEASFLVDGEAVEIVMVDISERMANERALAESQREVAELAEDFRLVADEVPTPVFRCDLDGRIDFRNSQWAETFPDLAAAQHLHELFAPTVDLSTLLDPEASDATRVLEAPSADDRRTLSIRCRLVGATPERRRFVGSITDITDTIQLRHAATHDPLTGLANRIKIRAELASALADDRDGCLVVYLDLDSFKDVNDSSGHEAGDAVLAEVARRLTRAVRPGDVVGRHGGDEFVVICRGVDLEDSLVIVERLRCGAFAEPIRYQGGMWVASASIGFARPEPGEDGAAVLRRADEAMFADKRSSRQSL